MRVRVVGGLREYNVHVTGAKGEGSNVSHASGELIHLHELE